MRLKLWAGIGALVLAQTSSVTLEKSLPQVDLGGSPALAAPGEGEKGEKGEGEKGEKGEGEKGEKGEKGEGEKGEKGEKGEGKKG
jgi:hypothetical protein